MYESHFGFTGTPFSLNPDPSFYFGSRGHGNALSYLKFGVHQGEGFVVVTGEIGAGKTTLVGTLLAEIDPAEIVAAHIVSTQLEAGDLLRSVAIAFGVAPRNLSKADLIATIEAFLTSLVVQKRRALLVVDEAQNLNRAAVEELRMLSNFQLGSHALLQSFLVGQPELRVLLTTKPMEQFRQRVIASCHLGPMDASETRAYVEHRLRKVGWTDFPSFDPAAFDEIHRFSAGIPRRVNLLCTRLLLTTYLTEGRHIDVAFVGQVADELRRETGESAERLSPSGTPVLAPSVHDAALPAADPARPAALVGATVDAAGGVLCVAASRADDIKMAALLHAMQRTRGLPSASLLRIGEGADFAADEAFFRHLGVPVPTQLLPVRAAEPTAQIAQVLSGFSSALAQLRPSLVVLCGSSDAVLACALACSKTGHRIAHVDAGRRAGGAARTNRLLMDTLTDVFCAADSTAYGNLIRDGVEVDRIALAGHLLHDAVRLASVPALAPKDVLARLAVPERIWRDKAGYAMVSLGHSVLAGDRQAVSDLLAMLRQASAELPLLWVMPPAVTGRLDALGLLAALEGERIAVVCAADYRDAMAMLSGAACVLTDSRNVLAEAAALQVPGMLLGEPGEGAGGVGGGSRTVTDLRSLAFNRSVRDVLDRGGRVDPLPRECDGRTGQRIAEHLARALAAGESTRPQRAAAGG